MGIVYAVPGRRDLTKNLLFLAMENFADVKNEVIIIGGDFSLSADDTDVFSQIGMHDIGLETALRGSPENTSSTIRGNRTTESRIDYILANDTGLRGCKKF